MAKLTKSIIDGAVYEGRQYKSGGWPRCVLWDASVPGLGVRIFPSGRKTFVLKYRSAGRGRLISIGDYGPLTLNQARAKAIDQEDSVYVRGALWLYLLTGVRKGELLRAKWEDIDWDARELRIPGEHAKSGQAQYIPLSEQAIAIAKALPRLKGNPYVFAGRNEGHHLVNIDKPWYRVRTLALGARTPPRNQ